MGAMARTVWLTSRWLVSSTATCWMTSNIVASSARRQYVFAISGAGISRQPLWRWVPGVSIISMMLVYVTTAISSM